MSHDEFSILLAKYSESARRLAFAINKNEHDADEAFEKATDKWREAINSKHNPAPGVYLHPKTGEPCDPTAEKFFREIVRCKGIDRWRKRKRQEAVEVAESTLLVGQDDDGYSVIENMADPQALRPTNATLDPEIIQKLKQSISAKKWECWSLHNQEGLTYAAITKLKQIPRETVKTNMRRANLKLREILARERRREMDW